MATPTPGKNGPAQAVATPPVSTPFSSSNNLAHLAFSPHGLNSFVPSPQQVRKSPATSNTIYNHANISSFGASYDSPSAAMALGGLAGLSDLGLDGLGGVASLRRDDEEDRRRKLEMVIEILKSKKGRVSESGIERLAQMVGFECLWETHVTPGQNSTRTLIIAGSTLALDIDFDKNIVKKVTLTFPDSPEIVTKHTDKASDVLWKDLELKVNQSPLTKTLDQFAGNLERLATLDKMSTLPELNCHEAIAGIFESLDRLHKWEMERLGEASDVKNTSKVAMCSKSGRPSMHTRNRLGLSLDYWQDSWRLGIETEGSIWTIFIDCDVMSPLIYTPLRVSQNWISPDIQKMNPPDEDLIMATDDGPILDWLEPENTLLTFVEPGTLNGHESSGNKKFPEAIFVAKFSPPLIVPCSLAVQIFDSVQTTMEMYQNTTYDWLVFPPDPTEKVSIDSRIVVREVTFPVFSKTGEKTTRVHRLAYNFEKIDYGRTLTELPFSHPQQLVQMLPALRQYALMSRILHNTPTSELHPTSKPEGAQMMSNHEEFESFMLNDLDIEGVPLRVDVLVSTQPFPRLRVQFPFMKMLADVHFEIKLNGIVEVIAQNILPVRPIEQPTGRSLTVADLGRMLEITESIGIWVEFVRRRLG